MATSKNTGLTLTLVFFVMATVFSAVVAIVMYQRVQDNVAQNTKDKTEAQQNATLAKEAQQDVNVLKDLLGKPGLQSVGDPNSEPDDQTVFWAVRQDIEKFAGDEQEKTVGSTLQKMHTRITELEQHLAERNKAFDDLQEKFSMLDQTQGELNKQIDDAKELAEREKQEALENHQTQLAAKDATIQDKQTEVNTITGQLDEAIRNYEDYKEQTDERLSDQKNLIRRLSKELADIKNLDWEVEDGVITWTSNDKKTVWINLGSSDHLPKLMSFSVYRKQHSGIARTESDIKGSIEITRILGPHRAEARVTNSDIYLPITEGDPIYTPLWNPGSREKMAIVGFIDLDKDGRDDRQRLREIIAASGAQVVAEILDDGSTLPADADFSKLITSDVKFLIQGDMPDPSLASLPAEKAAIQRILSHYKNMEDAALDNGVRILDLSKFLNFIGYRNERRLYRPGDNVGYRLKNGSRSASVDETIRRLGPRTQRQSGQNAGLYDRNRALRRRFSTGQTSKKYSGGGSGSR